MPLDPSDKAELLELLRESLAALKADLGKRGADADAERIWPTAAADAEHIWLTTKEAAAFMRMPMSSWHEFRKEHEDDLVICRPMQGSSDPRYQLAALRRYMLANAVGLPDPLPGMADLASTKANGKLRHVGLRPAGRS